MKTLIHFVLNLAVSIIGIYTYFYFSGIDIDKKIAITSIIVSILSFNGIEKYKNVNKYILPIQFLASYLITICCYAFLVS